MQKQHVRLLLLTIIIILVIYFIMYRSDMMMHELDQQMPVIGFIGLGIVQPLGLRAKSFRKLILGIMVLIFVTFFTQSGHTQVTISGSGGAANGSYTTLKLAFDALNAVNTQAGNSITVAITADIIDNNTAVLNQPSVSTWTSLTISPSGGSWTLSGSVNAPLVDLNGADHVIVDGLNTGGNALTISNTSTSSTTGTSTIRLLNDASNNTITNCTILGSSTGNAAQSGIGTIPATSTILIAGTNGPFGNDNNTITNNTIAEAGSNLPTVGICSSGQFSSISNDQVEITGNNIANFHSVNGANGIAVASNSSSFIISSNKFYQTSARTGMNSTKFMECIFINTPTGGGYTVNNNTIGYADSNGTGMLTNTFGRFAGIDITAVASAPVSEIQGNTINGINWYTNYSAGNNPSNASFYGIVIRAGGVNVGTSNGNTIGSQTGTGSTTSNVYIYNGVTDNNVCMIYLNSAYNCTISNNHIGAIAFVPAYLYFFGIAIEGSGSHTVLTNDIGGQTASSITVGATGGGSGICAFRGVNCNASGNGVIGSPAQGNIIRNITFVSLSYNEFQGIINAGNAPSLNINHNTIQGIVYSATTGSNGNDLYAITNSGNVTNALTINYNHFGTAASGLVSYEQVSGYVNGSVFGISCFTLAPAATLSISNNDFRGITYAGTGSGSNRFIYWNHSGSVTDNIINNTFTNLNVNTIGPVTFMERTGNMTSTGVENVNGNTIVTGFTKNADGNYVAFYKASGSSVTGSVMNNQSNNFSNVTVGGQTDIEVWVNQNGTHSTNGPVKIISNNIFNNLTTSSSSSTYIQGMSINYAAAGSYISTNTLQNWTAGGQITGINFASSNTSNGNLTVSQNLICGFTSQTGSSVTGIYSQLNNSVLSKNKICDLATASITGSVTGIAMATSGSSGTHTISNNLIGNLTASVATGSNAVIGMDLTSNVPNTTYNVYYNTIYMSSTGGAGFGSSGIFHQSSVNADRGKLNLRNNIIINLSVPGAGGLCVAFRRSHGNSNDLNNYASTSNNNLFYAGTPAADHLIYYDGVSNATTIAAYRAGIFTAGTISPRDAQSVSQAIVPASFFLTMTSSSPDFLHINPVNPTQIESGGTSISGLSEDYEGDTRNAQTPDIGADEGTFILSDAIGPIISYSLIPNSIVANTQSFNNVMITDLSNVEGNAGIRPRVYYKRSGDANTFNDNTSSTTGWKFVEANGSTSPFAFTIDYTLLSGGGGISAGNTIQYFVVAQDQIVPPNVGMFSGVFTNPPVSVALTASAFPIAGSLNSFIILNSFSGTISMPGTYTTLTGAGGLFEAINAGVVTGNLSIEISANLTTETGLYSLNEFTAPYTIKFYPVGTSRTISGSVSNTALIRLNGADRVTIDGALGGTGTGRNLTISNNSSTSPSVIALQSLGTFNGAHHNTIKNCNINFGNQNATGFGITVGGTAPGTAGADNDDVTIQNNNIYAVATGIYTNGTSASSSGGNDNLQIIDNAITINTSALECIGIRVGNTLNSDLLGNILNVYSTVPIYPVGISIETGFILSEILNNKIIAVLSSGTTGYGGRGITVGTGTTSSNLTIANNVIYNVNGSNNSSMISSSMGICIGLLGSSLTTSTTGGVKIYYNSVNMYFSIGIFTNAITTALYIGSSASNLDIRDNVFSNTQPGTSNTQKNYAIYSAAPASAFTTINFNDYYVSNAFYPAGAIPGFLISDRVDLPAIQSGFGHNANSIIANPFFFANDDLRPSSGYVVGSADNTSTGISTDFLSVARHTSLPPSGSTMGAYENPYDVTAPVIQLNAIAQSCSTGDRTFTGTISDNLGVPITGSFVPRVYFKKNGGAYFSSPGVLTSGNAINGTWTFTISASTMGGLTGGDVISYFVITQDIAEPLNIKSNPSAGLVATNVNNVSTPPVAPVTHAILWTLGPGTYSVGSGTTPEDLGHFTTLTSAIQAYNTGCLAGATVFVLTSATYAGSETFPITINQHLQASSTNTLTIKPAAGLTPAISGSASTALIDFNGADYIIIDGSNNNTTTKDLTISNTNTSGAVIRFSNDAIQNAIKNSLLKGVNSSGSSGVIYFASTSLSTGNDFNLIQNNDITSGVTANANGIYNSGSTITSTLKNSGIQVIGNNIYNFSNAGILDNGGSVGTLYQNNQIYEVITQSTGQLFGYSCNANTIEGFNFRGNRIYDMKMNGFNIYGLYIAGLAAGSSNTGEVSNNMIALNTTGNQDMYGIADYAPGGTFIKINFNSVSIYGPGQGFSIGYYRSSLSTTEFKNNIISMTKSNSGAHFGMYLIGGTLSNFTSDYNNLYAVSWSYLGYYSNTTLYDLAYWKYVTNQDQHSLSIEPIFQSPADLHFVSNANCGLDGAGISITGITIDLDNDNRNSPPDIGADEFTSVPLAACPAGPAQILCASSALMAATAGPAGSTGTWSIVAGYGTFSPNVNSPTATVNNLGTGLNTFKWTVKYGSCTVNSNVNITNNSVMFPYCHDNLYSFAEPITCTAPVSYELYAIGNPSPTFSYAFSGATTATGMGTGSGSQFNIGITNVAITATNGCGPDVYCYFTVEIFNTDISVSGNNANIQDGQIIPTINNHTDFDTAIINTNLTRTFTITNTADLFLNIGEITITGANASMFTASSPLVSTLYSGQSTTFTVTFTPTSLGWKTATIHIANSDCDESDFDFAVKGISNNKYYFHGNGLWTDQNKWSPSYPGLTIQTGIGAYAVNSASLTIPSEIKIIINGDVIVPSYASANGDITIGGQGTFSVGVMDLTDTLLVQPDGHFTVTDWGFYIYNYPDGALLNHGITTINNAEFANESMVYNYPGATLISNYITTNNALFENHGIFIANGTMAGWIQNMPDGTMKIAEPDQCLYNYDQLTTQGTLELNINGTTNNCTFFDRIYGIGYLELAGTLKLNINYTPSNNDAITILEGGLLINQFAVLDAPPGWTIHYNDPLPNKITVKFNCTGTMITSQPIATQTDCQNTSPSILSVSASGTGLQYQWYVDSDNLDFNGSSIMGATSSTYMPPTTIPGTNYYYSSVIGACGTINTQYAEVNVNATGRWLGTVSSDWHTASNWCGGVPDMATDVIIPPATFHPIVSTANAVCHHLTLLPTAALEVNAPRELRVKEN